MSKRSALGGGKEMRYDVPLYDGSTAHLWLPKQLAEADAERMRAFIAALVIDASTTTAPPSPEVSSSRV